MTPTLSRLFLLLLLLALPPALPCSAQTPPFAARMLQGITAHRELAYVSNGHERQKLDLYLPEKGEGPLPLIVWVHGGGWQSGSKDGCPPVRSGYVQKGYAVASINYRLSGDAPFPAQIEDTKAAIRWLRVHAKEYRIDPDHIGVWGSSAGGHLVALAGTSGDEKSFEVGENRDVSSRVQAVCDYYGPTDLNAFVATPGYERHAKADSPEVKLLGGTIQDNPDKVARLNPITYVSPDDPPFLILHSDKDPVVPIGQSELLLAALRKAGVAAEFKVIEGAGHGGPGFQKPEIEGMVSAFFEKHLQVKR